MKTSVLALLVVALASAACGGNSGVTAPSTTTPTSSTSAQTFSGSLDVRGSSFYSFTVATAETVGISLASLTANIIGPASTAVMRLQLGVPLGTGCSVSNSVDTAAGLTTQLTASVNPDTYCAQISDIGNLTAPANFSIRIVEGATSSSSGAASTTATFSSFLAARGSSARTFPVSQSGTIGLTLTSVTPSAIVGLGIGIPATTGPTCSLSRSVDATSGSTLAAAVDPGTYCVEIYDGGKVTGLGVSFSMTIDHP